MDILELILHRYNIMRIIDLRWVCWFIWSAISLNLTIIIITTLLFYIIVDDILYDNSSFTIFLYSIMNIKLIWVFIWDICLKFPRNLLHLITLIVLIIFGLIIIFYQISVILFYYFMFILFYYYMFMFIICYYSLFILFYYFMID